MTFQSGFLLSIMVILLSARLLGEAAQRLGQPPVLGQLFAGILLGPSVLGALSPHVEQVLFPPDPMQRAALQAFAEFGILLLLVLTGMEANPRRLALRRRVQANAADLDIDSALWSAMGIEKRRELREAMAPRSGRMAPPLKMGDGHVCRRLRLHERTILAASTRVDDCDETAPSWPGTLGRALAERPPWGGGKLHTTLDSNIM